MYCTGTYCLKTYIMCPTPKRPRRKGLTTNVRSPPPSWTGPDDIVVFPIWREIDCFPTRVENAEKKTARAFCEIVIISITARARPPSVVAFQTGRQTIRLLARFLYCCCCRLRTSLLVVVPSLLPRLPPKPSATLLCCPAAPTVHHRRRRPRTPPLRRDVQPINAQGRKQRRKKK